MLILPAEKYLYDITLLNSINWFTTLINRFLESSRG